MDEEDRELLREHSRLIGASRRISEILQSHKAHPTGN